MKTLSENNHNNEGTSVWVSIIYIIVLVILLGAIVYFLAIAPNPSTNDPDLKEKSDSLKTIFSTVITLVFGTASKSFHKALHLAPYNFDEDKFKKNQEKKIMNTTVEIFIDLMSGVAILIYILKYFDTSNLILISIGIGATIILIGLWFWAFYKSEDKITK